ncbi:ankyrin repeat domain-containing protein [Rhodoferax sp. PAMC 29310]|uniref:ankyrin repeat domain-containing protein n=1 Tax=Rhodoferax sp. PAMC 29310 TaxID=2822760 RepID=UPI001B31FAB1|nr:ankyrin repeat domain-containing protein [Rhodoferax sp. PAMC 29310]
MTKTIIPKLGALLRTAITRAGYRGFIATLGLDKDLDDIATEARPSSTADLMLGIESACSKQLGIECGGKWAQFFTVAWSYSKNTIQHLSCGVDTSPMANEQGQEGIVRSCVIPMLSELLLSARSQQTGPIDDQWWDKPFASWIQWAAVKANISTELILANLGNHFEVDPRSVERWMAGDPTGGLRWPYRAAVEEALGKNASERLKGGGIDQLCGWLVVTVGFQSLPSELRDRIRRDFKLRSQQPWSLEQTILMLNKHGFVQGDRPIRSEAVPLLQKIESLFSIRPQNKVEIQKSLSEFQVLIEQETSFWQRPYQYMHHWFSARLAGIAGQEAEALRLYDAALTGVWWYGGANQHPIVNEAMVYAVGVGAKVIAESYWDKTFLLGLNKWPKRPLDEQEMRRISFGFEKMFSPQKAKARIPPKFRVILTEGEFENSPQALTKPNSKVKHAEGRIRCTPLMEAIRDGTLRDVQQLLEAGGDPNDYIKESGEGPLSYAMRRACDRKDPLIMTHLLSLDLLPETVNRQASTKRETPLKIAIEMADATAVERLIELDADVEARCDHQPSALCYAMLLLHGSLFPEDPTQIQAYLAGKGRADVYDAKDGAVLDIDLAARRQPFLAKLHSAPHYLDIFNAIKRYFIRPPDDCRKVIHALLRCGANANRRYKVETHHIAEWTPTLFAAQVGDLSIFEALIENGGNPDLTLMQSSSLERQDALWVAIAHGRHAIVDFLTKRRQRSPR